jgi:pyroglutamyl-peptidase
MRVLVYGFGAYKQFKDNITRRIVRKLPPSANLKKIIFPVRFHKTQFTAAIKKHRPDVILGLGQCSTGAKLRIERRAVNRRRNNKVEKGRAIARGGPKALAATLRLDKPVLGKQAKISRDAGDYVCNFSMYVMLDYLRRRSKAARFGFVHVPCDYDRKRAVKWVTKILRMLER